MFSLLLAASLVVFRPPALPAGDLAFVLSTMASGDRTPAATVGPPCLVLSSTGASPAADVLVRAEFPSARTTASISIKEQGSSIKEQAPAESRVAQANVARAKREAPATVVPGEANLQWKGAFGTARWPAATLDSRVVQASAEVPLDAAQPSRAVNPPRREPGSRLAPSPDRSLAAGPPLPIQIGPATEPGAAPPPTLEQQLAGQPNVAEKCISPRDLKSIRQITADIGVSPADLTGDKQLPPECTLGDTPLEPRRWHRITFAWTAASTCHNPLYFEEEQLERYGHSWGPVKQTAASAVQFFATVPLLPYFMGVYPPNECIYDLGQYQPGSCAPYYLDPLPLSVRGALYEGSFLGILPAL